MADRIQLRRDTRANWEAYNPILLEGEPGHVLDDPNLYKMGDGIHAWNDLPYRGYNGTVTQDIQNVENSVPSNAAVFKAISEETYNFINNPYNIKEGINNCAFFNANMLSVDNTKFGDYKGKMLSFSAPSSGVVDTRIYLNKFPDTVKVGDKIQILTEFYIEDLPANKTFQVVIASQDSQPSPSSNRSLTNGYSMYVSDEIEVTSEILNNNGTRVIGLFIPAYADRHYPAKIYVGRIFIGLTGNVRKIWSRPDYIYNQLKESIIKNHSFKHLTLSDTALDGCTFDYTDGYKKIIIPAGVNTNSYIGYLFDSNYINKETKYRVSIAVKRSKNAPKKDILSLTTNGGTADKTQTFIKTVETTNYFVDYYYAEISNIQASSSALEQFVAIQGFNNTTNNNQWYAIDVVIESDLGVYTNDYIEILNRISALQNSLSSTQESLLEEKRIKHHPFDYLNDGGEALNGCSFDYESGYKKLIIPAGVTNTPSYIGYYLDKARVNVESTYFVSVAVKRSKNAPKKDILSLTTNGGTADKTQTFIKTVEYNDYAIDYYYAEISNIVLDEPDSYQWIAIQGFNNTTENDWWYAIDTVVRSSLGVYQNEILELRDDLQQTKSDLTNIQDFIEFKKVSVVAYNGNSPVQEYFRNKYVVYNEPFEKNCRLTKLSLNAYQWYINSNAVLYIYVGTLLQAHDTGTVGEWFLNVRQYAIELSKITYTIPSADLLVISDFRDYEININKGECIGFLSQNDGHEPCIVIQYSNEVSDDKVYICETLEGTFVKANHNIRRLTFDVVENNLVSQGEIDNLDKRIDLVNEEISQIDIITDRTTSQKYILVVNNAVIGLKPLIYSKAAIIGSSCVMHGRSEAIGYYRTENGSMVPSVSEYTWENFTLKALRQKNNQATISKSGCAGWEVQLYDVVRDGNNNITGYTERTSDFSFLSIITNDTDLVIMQLMGNTPTTFDSDETKEMLIQLLKNKAIELFEQVNTLSPTTDIYMTEVTRNAVKVEALQRAANELSYVHYVYVNGWGESGFRWAMGDYYAEDNDALGTLYPITHGGVAGHGGEYFFYNATKLMMKAAGYDFSYPLYTITLNQSSGGTISTPNTTWFENSVVNIRCAADSGKSISSIVVKNESGTDVGSSLGLTKRTNDYGTWYTFKMPAYNVIVTPTWV